MEKMNTAQIQRGSLDMDKTVIYIFGASGAGTTALGRFICGKTGYFFMDTDDYLWQPTNPPFTDKRESVERLRLMRNDIDSHENVVISGSLSGWGDPLIPEFTLAIRVNTDTELRLQRLVKREHDRFGTRIDKGGDMYEIHRSFINWALSYDTAGLEMRSKASHDEWQKLLRCKLIEVDGGKEMNENYEIIRRYI